MTCIAFLDWFDFVHHSLAICWFYLTESTFDDLLDDVDATTSAAFGVDEFSAVARAHPRSEAELADSFDFTAASWIMHRIDIPSWRSNRSTRFSSGTCDDSTILRFPPVGIEVGKDSLTLVWKPADVTEENHQ